MIQSIAEFDKLPEPAKTTLWFLRGLRDAIANNLIESSGNDDFAEQIEKLCGYLWANPHYLKKNLTGSLLSGCNGDLFDLLWFLIKRIARLERESIPGYYIEPQLLNA